MADLTHRPWAWRSLLAILVMGSAGSVLASATPETVEPKIDIAHEEFTLAGARSTVAAVRRQIDDLTLDQALEIESTLVEEYPLLDRLAAPDFPDGLAMVLFGVGAPLAAGLFGAFILRKSGSSLGRWIVVGAMIAAAQGLGVAGTEFLTRQDAPDTIIVPFAIFAGTGWIALGVAYFPNLVATFPTGAPLSLRWRRLFWLSGAAALLLVSAVIFSPLYAFDTRVNPLGLWSSHVTLLVFNAGLALWAVAILGAVTALVLRFFRSRGEERQQLKWAAVGAGFAALAAVAGSLLDEADFPEEVVGALQFVPLFVVLPVILIITVFRHRLYDVDIVINKTVTVAILAAVVTAIYAAAIFGVGALLDTDEVGFGLQVGAAVAVAIAFHPVRRRAQRLANRLVYGHRATPYEVLSRFSHRAAEVSDEQLLERIPRLVVDGTGAVTATLWVRTESQMEAVAAWPEDVRRAPIEASPEFVDPYADFSLPIRNAGELLGGLSLTKARGESMSPAEERLVEGLTAGLGMVLRNTGLRAELRRQVEALSASRDRVVAAADEARRALERDLDSGPQQRLVAVKVMLGPVRKQAERAGAEKTAAMLARLEEDASEAIRSVREFASGIYPPLLEAEGLVAATTHQARRASLPVEVEAEAVKRYPREVEAAAYFTVLEALQNAVKYSQASVVEVALAERDGRLTFTVRDDGVGFDPTSPPTGSGLSNMADRMDSLAGELRLESMPGSGTTVSGSIPVGSA
ncbi:MAG TPA: ATP-binding protein [Acidimicrobiia bacterium]|nr:ATP-binding protein [Acidimicrobiia bacterium]